MRLKRFLGVALAAVISTEASALINGTKDDSDRFPFVVSLKTQTDIAAICTGFLIRPKIIMTAAHCVVDNNTGRPGTVLEINVSYRGRSSTLSDNPVASLIIPRIMTRDQPMHISRRAEVAKYDFALIVLKESIDVPLPKTVFDYVDISELAGNMSETADGVDVGDSAMTRYSDKFWLALTSRAQLDKEEVTGLRPEIATIVGYGVNAMNCREHCFDGTRRFRQGSLYPWDRCDVWPPHYPGNLLWWCQSGAGISSGDSGGPLIVKSPEGDVVVGVVSFSTLGLAGLPSLFSAAYWINKAIKQTEGGATSAATQTRIDERLYSVKPTVSAGILNMRDGPGQGHSVVLAIPAGSQGIRIGECSAPDDGRSQYEWCQATWQGYNGWVSANGISPD